MSLNRKCPRCGSDFVQLTNERSRHGCFFTLLFGIAACQKPKQFRPPAIAAAISGKRIRQPIHLPSCTLTGM